MEWNSFAIDLKRHWLLHGICEFIEVAGNRFVARPAGDTHVHDELRGFVGDDRHFNGAIPRVMGCLRDLKRAAIVHFDIGRARGEKVDVECVAFLRINVTRDGSEKTRDVAWATRDAEPWTALVLAVGFERVRVEEAFAVERDA